MIRREVPGVLNAYRFEHLPVETPGHNITGTVVLDPRGPSITYVGDYIRVIVRNIPRGPPTQRRQEVSDLLILGVP